MTLSNGVVAAVLLLEAIIVLGGWLGRWDRRRTAYLRVVVFVVFAVLVFTGVIAWAPRYYALGAWLLLLAVWATVRELRHEERAPVRRGPMVGAAVVTALVLVPAVVFPDYAPLEPSGEFAVRTTAHTITPSGDAGDSRWVGFGVWSPDVAHGSFPLIVFSHGAMGVRDSNPSLFADLASHGYVVVSVDHPGHSLYADGTGRRAWIDPGYLRALQRENAREEPERSHESYREWMAVRVADIEVVLDHVLAGSNGPDATAEFALVDGERIGLVGHSLGGAAVLAVARERDDIGAVVALEAPFMGDIIGVEDGAFVWDPEPFPVPVLAVYTDSSWEHLGEWPQYARNHELLEDPGAPHLHLDGVGHLHLTDLALSSPLLTRLLNGHPSPRDAREALRELNSEVLDFFDARLTPSPSSSRDG